MPEMDGFETASWLNKNYPKIKVLALSMFVMKEPSSDASTGSTWLYHEKYRP
jgi:CheY-like chemotaxis protein